MNSPDWYELVIALFGGGVIGSLVTFFVNRHDAKKEKQSSFYQGVYNHLSEYNSELYSFLVGFIQNNADISDSINASKTNESSIVKEIECLNKDINKYVRKCNKNGGPIDGICSQCQEAREKVSKLSTNLIEEQRIQTSLYNNQSSYWDTRLDNLKACAAKYMNMSALLSSGGIAKKSIQKVVNKVDVKSVFIIGYRKQDMKDVFDVADLIINLLESIDSALKELSKNIK